jgi:hypothetical protein
MYWMVHKYPYFASRGSATIARSRLARSTAISMSLRIGNGRHHVLAAFTPRPFATTLTIIYATTHGPHLWQITLQLILRSCLDCRLLLFWWHCTSRPCHVASSLPPTRQNTVLKEYKCWSRYFVQWTTLLDEEIYNNIDRFRHPKHDVWFIY